MVAIDQPSKANFYESFSAEDRQQLLAKACTDQFNPSYRNPDRQWITTRLKRQTRKLDRFKSLTQADIDAIRLHDATTGKQIRQNIRQRIRDLEDEVSSLTIELQAVDIAPVQLLIMEAADRRILVELHRNEQPQRAIGHKRLIEAHDNGRLSAANEAIANEKLWIEVDDDTLDEEYPPCLGDLRLSAENELRSIEAEHSTYIDSLLRSEIVGKPIKPIDFSERLAFAEGRLEGFTELCRLFETLSSSGDELVIPVNDWLNEMEKRRIVWTDEAKRTSEAATTQAKAPSIGQNRSSFPPPPDGFINQVVEYNLKTARRRQPELALFGAIALLATLTSRKVKSGQRGRPNLSIVALSGTTSGKQHAREVNSDILKLSGAEALLLGNDFTSDIALFRALEQTGAGLSQVDEFGRVLAGASKVGTRQHEIVTSLMMLATSEGDASCRAKTYADASRSVSLCYPCFSIYATGTIEPFYEAIGAGSVDDGFLGRLLVVKGRDRVPNTTSTKQTEIPSEILSKANEWFSEGGNLIGVVKQGSAIPAERIIPTTELADGLFAEFSEECDQLAWKGHRFRLYGRAFEKASKLAIVYACSVSRSDPVIDHDAARWAIEVSRKTTADLVHDCDNWLAGSIFEANCNELFRMVSNAKGKSLTMTQLCRQARKWKSKERNELIASLVEQKRLELTSDPASVGKDGRPITIISVIN